MANITGKFGGQGRLASKSKAESNPGKSASRSSENAAFALAAGSIGLAVTLLDQDRTEAAAKAIHESSVGHTSADDIVASGDPSSSIDYIATSSTQIHEGLHTSSSDAISPAAKSGGEVAVGLGLPGEQVADYKVHQDANGAPATVQDNIAMSSSKISHEASLDHTSEHLTLLQVNTVEGINHDPQSHVDGLQFPAVSAPSDNGISQDVDSAADGVLGTVGDVVDGVGGLVENLLDGDGKGVLAGVGSTVGSVLDTVGNVISGVGGIVENLLGGDGKGVLAGVGSTVDSVLDTVSNVISGVGGIVDNVLNTVGGVVSSVGDIVPNLLGDVKEGVVHTVGNVVDTVADVTSSIGGIVNGLIGGDSKDTLSDAGSTIIEAVDTVAGAVSGAGGTVSNLLGGDGKESLTDVGSTIDNALDSVGGALTGAGEVVGGLLGGSASAPTNMLDAATGLLNFSDELFGVLTPTLSFLGQSIFVPNDPVDLSNHHGTTMHGLTWEG
ncbi:collagen-like triple helix repeat-containing protein [Phyllobacterium sp. K27]